MLPQSPSQIYKAQLRGNAQDDTYRCLSTFNFGAYYDVNRKPFGNLKVFNEETLGAQQTKQFSVENNEVVILIPLVGSIDYTDNFDNENYIETEEIQVLKTSRAVKFQIQNPYENDLINYLQIRMESSEKNGFYFDKKTFDFDKKNELFPILENKDYTLSIGIFNLRTEGVYPFKKSKKGAFAFVINGAFEFQNRLLESRDALAIWKVSEIEFEALSDHAILLLIETSLQH